MPYTLMVVLGVASAVLAFLRKYLSTILTLIILALMVLLLEFRSSLIETGRIQTKQLAGLTEQVSDMKDRQEAMEQVMYVVNGTLQMMWDKRAVTDAKLKQLRDKTDELLMEWRRSRENVRPR